jgi:DNA invertase Pin-like site-specific DNA recombinase
MRRKTVVIYDRLSRLFAEEAPDHRIAACKAHAEQQGWEVVHVATDTNVSGASKLEDRPGMREVLAWLPRADYVLAAKLDRYARSVLEFQRLLDAAKSTNATIVTADGVVSPQNASLIINVLAAFAEYERDMIKARITDSKEHFRSRGNHLGGLAPYGYAVDGPVNNKRWVIDETAAATVRECADRLTNHGGSLTGLAHELNERGVLPPADHARQRTNQPVLDSEGRPVSAGPAILDAETWTSVRAILDNKAKGRGAERSGKALLLHVARCSECDGPMYRQRREERGKDFSTYVCRNGVGKRGTHRPNVIVAGPVEAMVTADYLKVFGRVALMRWAEPDGGAVLQLSEVTMQIERLAGNLAQLDPTGTAARVVITQLTALEKRQAELRAEADHAVGRWVDAGGTVADEWERRDDEGRRALLADLGTRVAVRPATPGAPKRFDGARVAVTFEGPAWFRDDPAAGELAGIAMTESGILD